jgi:hypothetical protein
MSVIFGSIFMKDEFFHSLTISDRAFIKLSDMDSEVGSRDVVKAFNAKNEPFSLSVYERDGFYVIGLKYEDMPLSMTKGEMEQHVKKEFKRFMDIDVEELSVYTEGDDFRLYEIYSKGKFDWE